MNIALDLIVIIWGVAGLLFATNDLMERKTELGFLLLVLRFAFLTASGLLPWMLLALVLCLRELALHFRKLSVVLGVLAVSFCEPCHAAQHVYGRVKDAPENPAQPDRRYRVAAPIALPASVDLRTNCPAVYDQGQLGSCTANAIAAAYDFENHLQGQPWLFPSRLFIYFCEREMEGTIGQDAGAQLRDGLSVVTFRGCCPDSVWPYIVANFAKRPPLNAYMSAKNDQVLQSLRVQQDLVQIRAVLAQGHPVVFGFTVYSSFESAAVAKTGLAPMPGKNEQILGGHAVLIVGYCDTLKMPGAKKAGAFLVRNSWGASWGLQGYFWIAYEYLTNAKLASDFWAILKVE